MKIKYVKMPISIEEKREFNKQGFRVVDAKFDPSPEVLHDQKEIAPPKAKRKYKSKQV